MRRFYLMRIVDATGVSGCGRVAEGVEFSDGAACLRWLSETASTVLYNNVADLMKVHLHGGLTQFVWEDGG